MAYTKQTWADGPSGNTPITSARLGYIEQGIADAHALVSGGTSGWYDVTDYGAVGNSSDVSASANVTAIRQAITAADVGGTVYFPKQSGTYRINESIKPLSGQTWVGGHNPFYQSGEYVTAYGGLRAAASFTGSALIHNTDSKVAGVTLKNLCLQGNGEAGTLNGVDLGSAATTPVGEIAWKIQDCQFSAFGGAAVCGRAWVFDMRDTHISRCGYAWRPSAGAAGTAAHASDVRIIGCQFYFNYHGGIYLNGTTNSHGAITVVGCRIERSGSTPGNVTVNRDQAACGIKVDRMSGMFIIGCYTDANASYGLNFEAAAQYNIVHCGMSGNMWNRDSSGNGSTTTTPGVRIYNSKYVTFHGDHISYGGAADGGGGYVVPKYGIEFNATQYCRFDGVIDLPASTNANAVILTGTNDRIRIDEPRLRSSLSANIETNVGSGGIANPVRGDMYYDTTGTDAGSLKIYDGAAWRKIATVAAAE